MTNRSITVPSTRHLLSIATATLAALGLSLALDAALDLRVASAAQQWPPAPPAPQRPFDVAQDKPFDFAQGRPAASVNQQPRVDVLGMARPIEMHDSIWIEDLTMMEVRDLIKSGTTTALILTGGIEENGPYLTTGKHNNVLRVTGDSIARSLGNALAAPIVTLEPGNPERVRTPGTVLLSPETYRAVLTDMAVSLKTQGFTDIVLLGDSGGNLKPMQEAAEALNAKWKGSGTTAYFVPEYYNYDEVEKFEQEALGIHEKMEGLHDDYYISSIIMVHDVNGVRAPERIKAGKFTINGVNLAPVEKTIENGRRIVKFRTEKTVAAIRKAMAAAR